MKHMTRRQVAALFAPIRHALLEMLSGEVDSIHGYAVTRLHSRDAYERVDFCLAGFAGVIARIFPDCDLSPMTRLQKRLANGTPIHPEEIHAALKLLKELETPLIKADWRAIKSALTTEMIQIEIDQLGMAA